MNNKFSVIVAIVACLFNTYLAGEHNGSERGYKDASTLYKACNDMSFSGDNNFLAESHIYLTLCLVFFLIGKLLMKEVSSLFIGLISLISALFIYLGWVTRLIGNSELTFFTNLQQTTSILDLLSFSLVLVLLIYQIKFMVNHFFVSSGEI